MPGKPQLWSQQVAMADAYYGEANQLEHRQPVVYEFAGANKRDHKDPYENFPVPENE